ncbi:glycosyltransferase family 2 protein [Desulfococcus sp.]|uniref:glycosyltransferase family 2 protein n=1 Tax=Desulfococcus sp. TaxID=2025834 RepID=UPI0035943261
MAPLVSIGMPVFNCEKTIAAAIRSILGQTMESWELLIIDDGSTDNTVAVARSLPDPRIHILSDGVNRGLPRRLNQAVALGRGRYFARMDGDDVAYPERFAIQADCLDRHPGVDLVCARVLIFDSDGRIIGTYPFRERHEDICRHPWGGFYFPHPTWMGRLKWFHAHPYDPVNARSEDQCLLLSSFRTSRFHGIPRILLGYRQARLSLTKILKGRMTYSAALAREAFSTRRYGLSIGVFEQACKGILDGIAIGTGLDYRVLRHRALPVSRMEAVEWDKIWVDLNRAHAGARVGKGD